MKYRDVTLLNIILVIVLALSILTACFSPAPVSTQPAQTALTQITRPVAFPIPAADIPPVELKMWSGWASNAWTTDPYMHWFLERVNAAGATVNLKITYTGGPELFPPNRGMEALKGGLVDAVFTTTAYHVGLVPEADALKLSRIRPWEERETGAYDMMNRWHQEKAKAWYSWRLPHDDYFSLYLNVERTTPDLTGLKIRTTPIYTPVIRALGGQPITMDPGEVYTALEKNMVDGYGWPSVGIADYKWEEVTRYKWGPPFYSSPTGVWYNLDKWNSLHPAQREFLTEQGKQAELDAAPLWARDLEEEWETISSAGVREIKFSEEDSEKFVDMAFEEGWKDLLSRVPGAAAYRPLVEQE